MAKTKKIEEITPEKQIMQQIANLCTSIGDRRFVIDQAEKEIVANLANINELRGKLKELSNGSQNTK